MRPGQIPGGHQKLVHDLPACEDKRLFEELNPFLFRESAVCIQPAFERAVLFSQLEDHLRVEDRRIDLQAIADDACIGQQTSAVLLPIFCDLVNVKAVIGLAEIISFSQDGDPGKSRLVDLEDQPFEQQVIVFEGKSILCVMIRLVERILRVRVAVVAVGGHRAILLLPRVETSHRS